MDVAPWSLLKSEEKERYNGRFLKTFIGRGL
jgi:hypothetical protein